MRASKGTYVRNVSRMQRAARKKRHCCSVKTHVLLPSIPVPLCEVEQADDVLGRLGAEEHSWSEEFWVVDLGCVENRIPVDDEGPLGVHLVLEIELERWFCVGIVLWGRVG